MELLNANKLSHDEELNLNNSYNLNSSRSSSVASEDLLVWSKENLGLDESDRESQFLFSSPQSHSGTNSHDFIPSSSVVIKQSQHDQVEYSQINRLLDSVSPTRSHHMHTSSSSDSDVINYCSCDHYHDVTDENRATHAIDDFIDLDIRPTVTVASELETSDVRCVPPLDSPTLPHQTVTYHSNHGLENVCTSFNHLDSQHSHCASLNNTNYYPTTNHHHASTSTVVGHQFTGSNPSNWNISCDASCVQSAVCSNRGSVILFNSNLSASSSSISSFSCVHLGLSPTALSSAEEEEIDDYCIKPPKKPSHYDCNEGFLRNQDRPVSDNSVISSQQSVMLIPFVELASGDSLTCTVVNILRGLNLLDRCGVEDLCASLYDFWDNCSSPQCISNSIPDTTRHRACADDFVVTRSSSFTSYNLVPPRSATTGTTTTNLSHRNTQQNALMLHKSKTNSEFIQRNCLVNYLLACSYAGTSFLTPSSTRDLNDPVSHCCFKPSLNCRKFVNNDNALQSSYCRTKLFTARLSRVSSICTSVIDWRKGCADNLVFMLTEHNHSGAKRSTSLINKLLTGRFLPGPLGWRTVWPNHYKFVNAKSTESGGHDVKDIASELASWFAVWIRGGCVPVLAQLAELPADKQLRTESSTDCPKSPLPPQELTWSHRLVCGVTEKNEIYLTNPNALVPVTYVVEQLSKQTKVLITRYQIYNLWSLHCIQSKSSRSNQSNPSGHTKLRTHHSPSALPFFSSEGLSLLAQHSDPRWVSMNIMGQVLCILRNLERWTDHVEKLVLPPSSSSSSGPNHLYQTATNMLDGNNKSSNSSNMRPAQNLQSEQISSSPAIVIPSAQLPGISLFVAKSNWDLVRTLFQTNCFE